MSGLDQYNRVQNRAWYSRVTTYGPGFWLPTASMPDARRLSSCAVDSKGAIACVGGNSAEDSTTAGDRLVFVTRVLSDHSLDFWVTSVAPYPVDISQTSCNFVHIPDTAIPVVVPPTSPSENPSMKKIGPLPLIAWIGIGVGVLLLIGGIIGLTVYQ